MARIGINTGAAPDDGTGDSLRAGGGIINENFREIYTYFGFGSTTVLGAPLWEPTSIGINTLSNVGIGTTNPTSQLTVRTSSTTPAVRITQSGAGLAFRVDDIVNDATPFVINTSGKVGIGTTNPTSKLTVSGAADITGIADVGSLRITGISTLAQATATGFVNTGISTLATITATSLNSTGIVTATSFSGNGSTLTGIPGIGTALSTTTTSVLNKIYFTDNTLNITETTTIDVPSTASLSENGFRVAYTNYAEIVVGDTFDLIISDGDELALDVLALT